MNCLPKSDYVDVKILNSLLENSLTTTYKLFWFKGILNEVKNDNNKISFERLNNHMITEAWHPLLQCNLDFGSIDQLYKITNEIKKKYNLSNDIKKNDLFKVLEKIKDKGLLDDIKNLSNYVPFRLISPFFTNELRGLSDSEKNKCILNLSNSNNKVIYKIDINKREIIINNNWFNYFSLNQNAVDDWLINIITKHLELKNPNTSTSLLKKILSNSTQPVNLYNIYCDEIDYYEKEKKTNEEKFKQWLYYHKDISQEKIFDILNRINQLELVFIDLLDTHKTVTEIKSLSDLKSMKVNLLEDADFIALDKKSQHAYYNDLILFEEYIRECPISLCGNDLVYGRTKTLEPYKHNCTIRENEQGKENFDHISLKSTQFSISKTDFLLDDIILGESDSINSQLHLNNCNSEYNQVKLHEYNLVDIKNGKINELSDILIGDIEPNDKAELLKTDDVTNNMSNNRELAFNSISRISKTAAQHNTPFYKLFYLDLNNYTDINLSEFHISVRARNSLKYSSINTMKELLSLSENDLIKIKNLGVKCCSEIIELINLIANRINNFKENDGQFENIDKQITSFKITKETKTLIDDLLNGKVYSEIERKSLNDENSTLFVNTQKAIIDLGNEICQEIYSQPQFCIDISQLLWEFSCETKQINRLKNTFKLIPNPRRTNKIEPFIKAYNCSNYKVIDISKLIEQLNQVSQVSDLFSLINTIKGEELVNQMYSFLKFISIDVNIVITDWFDRNYVKSNIVEIIKNRACGKTLDECGKIIGVTRERVRQIEAKFQRLFNSFNKFNNVIMMLYAIRNGDEVLTIEEIMKSINKYKTELVYLLKRSQNPEYHYEQNLDIFLIQAENSADKAQEFLDELPDTIEKNKLNTLIIKSIQVDNFSLELIEKMVADQYILTGNVYHRSKLRLNQIYSYILKERYKNGIKVYDDTEINALRDFILDEFGLVDLPKNNHAISARVAAITVLCDRGTHIHPDFVDISNQNVFIKIENYIDNAEEKTIFYKQIFETFQEELLLTTNITNRFFLQGALRLLTNDKYILKKDTLVRQVKNSYETPSDYLERFVYASMIENFFKDSHKCDKISDMYESLPELRVLKQEYIMNFLREATWCTELESETFIYTPENIVKSLDVVPVCYLKKDRTYMYREFQMINQETLELALKSKDQITWFLWDAQFEEFVELCLGYGILKVGELLFVPYRNEELIDRFYYNKLRLIIDRLKIWISDLTNVDIQSGDTSTEDILSLFWKS